MLLLKMINTGIIFYVDILGWIEGYERKTEEKKMWFISTGENLIQKVCVFSPNKV